MRILHTSDWHIGHRLYAKRRYHEHRLFFKWLYGFIRDNKVDILIVSGDIFDTSMPSTEALKIYYDFLISLKDTQCKNIIIVAGNHDSPSTLEAPKELLSALDILVVGKISDNLDDNIVKIDNIVVATIPFLRDRDIRDATSKESFDDISSRYKSALVKYYKSIANRCKELSQIDSFIIATGHLFVTNTAISKSESRIYIGNLGDISVNDFPDTFDYIALGHLHKAQKVGGKEHIRYSGTPIPLSFNEAKRDSYVVLLDIKKSQLEKITDIRVPKFRELISINGDLKSIEDKLKSIEKAEPISSLKPWVEIKTLDKNIDFTFNERYKNLEILKVSLDIEEEFNYPKEMSSGVELSSLTPEDIFKKKCLEEGFDLDINLDIKDIFYEILSTIREEE